MQNLLVQKILVDGNEIDISLLQSLTYIETLTLDGPKFIIVIQDQDNLIRDDLGLVEGVTITVVLSDEHVSGGLDITEDIIARSVTANAEGYVTVQGFPLLIDEAKKPAKKAIFLVGESVETILSAMMPGAAIDSDSFTAVDQFHLLPGDRPTRKLRQLARELGAFIYYQRNKLYLKKIGDLVSLPEFDTYHYRDRTEESQILTYKSLYRESLAGELLHKYYHGWDIVEGHIKSTLNGSEPVEIVQFNTLSQLDNPNWALLPVIDFGSQGRGDLAPSKSIKMKFHRTREGRPLDESLPEKVLIYLVAHHYAANAYKCRVKAGVVKNARE